MLQPRVTKKEMFAWASLDFANSGYTTVVLTTIFNVYFVTVIAGNKPEATFLWTATLSFSYLIIMLASPLIGAYADAKANHREILFVATICCSVSTIILGFCGPNNIKLVITLVIVSNFAYAIHQNITASLLTKIADLRYLGKVSGLGWAWGFVGGILALLLSLWWMQQAYLILPRFSLVEFDPRILGSLSLTGLLFLFVGCCSVFYLKSIVIFPANNDWRQGWRNLIFNLFRLKSQRDMTLLYLCVFFCHCGISAVITVSSIYASNVMNFSIKEIVGLILIVNISASIGSFLFGNLQDKVGHKLGLRIVLYFWVIAIILLFFSDGKPMFYICANLIGLGLGSAQSASRASVAYLAPKSKQAEYFGVWGLFVNASSIVGPLSYGILTIVFDNNHKLAAIGLIPFFIVSIVFLKQTLFVTPR